MRKQNSFFKTNWKHQDRHGGVLRRVRAGRGARALSTKHSVHLVFKTDLKAVPKGLRHPRTQAIVREVLRQYSKKFFVKIEQVSIQRDHIHCLIRAYRRSSYLSFFRVVAGQIAQPAGAGPWPANVATQRVACAGPRVTDTFEETYAGPRVWKARPFSRVVRGLRALRIVRDYIQLNEREALGHVKYRKTRLRGLTSEELRELWT